MSVILLSIDDNDKSEIKRVVNYAIREENRLSRSILEQTFEGIINPPGDDPNYVCVVSKLSHLQYKCVFTIDEVLVGQNPNWARHISVSCSDGNLPNVHVINILLKEFEFNNILPSKDVAIWIENENKPELPKAGNVMEILE